MHSSHIVRRNFYQRMSGILSLLRIIIHNNIMQMFREDSINANPNSSIYSACTN